MENHLPRECSAAWIKRLVLPTPYAVGPVNVYLVTGEEPALVDVGPPTREAVESLIYQLQAVGLSLADIRRVILTHAHPDHYGALALMPHHHWEVAAHPRAALWMADGQDFLEARVSFYVSFLRQSGVPAELLRALERDSLGLRQYPHSIPIHRFLQEGDTVVAGNHALRVLYTPGHSSSAVCLLRPDGVLFSGDTLLSRISSNALVEPAGSWQDVRRRSLPEYLGSLVRLQALPLKVVFTGHGNPPTDHRRLIAERLRFYRERRDAVLGFLSAKPATVYQLCLSLFPHLATEQLFLGLSEAVGYLDLLQAEGLVEVTLDRLPVYHSTPRGSPRGANCSSQASRADRYDRTDSAP